MKKTKNVTAYIDTAPGVVREKLVQIRKIIKTTAPDAFEKISYGIPYYGYKGRLAYFAAFKHHIGLYIPTPVIEEYKEELKNYDTSKATIRFPLDKKLPIALIKKLIRTRLEKNEAKGKNPK